MRSAVAILGGLFILAAFLLESSNAVTCTADATVTGCIDCTTSPTDAECVAEAAASSTTSTTTTTTTTTAATTTTATTASPSTSGTVRGPRRKYVYVNGFQYSATRRIRKVKKNSNASTASTTRNVRRTNNRRGNAGNVRQIVRVISG
ncbi:hypothetical protein KR018_004742 [Drosophila ironensis]|nr:hypothetical protein KR018_004742 [Drosophila ironensis]